MGVGRLIGSASDLRRKLRALAALAGDAGATEHEKANAAALKARLERRLRDAGTPAGDWTDKAFRLGKWTKEVSQTTAPASPKADWTDNALRAGKALRRAYKRLVSD